MKHRASLVSQPHPLPVHLVLMAFYGIKDGPQAALHLFGIHDGCRGGAASRSLCTPATHEAATSLVTRGRGMHSRQFDIPTHYDAPIARRATGIVHSDTSWMDPKSPAPYRWTTHQDHDLHLQSPAAHRLCSPSNTKNGHAIKMFSFFSIGVSQFSLCVCCHEGIVLRWVWLSTTRLDSSQSNSSLMPCSGLDVPATCHTCGERVYRGIIWGRKHETREPLFSVLCDSSGQSAAPTPHRLHIRLSRRWFRSDLSHS